MLSRLKTAAQGGAGTTGDDSAGTSKADRSSKWGRRSGGGKPAERDQFRVQQQGFYVRGNLTVDVFQARGLRLGSASERHPYCVVLVDRVKVGETPTASKTVSPVWNHPVKVSHESFRRAADTNVWPVPYQPLSVQVWDRSNTSDALLGTARVHITDALSGGDKNGWYKLVGTGDQAGVEEICGKIRVKVHWESETLASSPEDKPRLFLRDVFGPDQRDYQHLYYGGLCSTMLCPPAGEEALLEMMMGVSRHDVTANNHGKGVEGMLVLTELRLLFLPDIGVGSTTASFLEFNTVQVYLAAVRNFSHRGLEGGDRLLSITTRDGRFVHFRMPAAASAARCGTWFDTEGPQQQRRRWRVGGGAQSSSGREELWKRGLWGAGTSELWMERLVDEIRWRKASGDFVALWHKLSETAANPRATAAATIAVPSSSSSSSAQPPSSQAHHAAASASNNAAAVARLTAIRAAAAAADARGDLADGRGALERDLERMGVPKAGGGGGASYAAFGRQMWEFKPVNKDYALSPTYPQALAFPSSITPAQLSAAAPQRSRNRVPALVWLHPASKAPLCRSSQPMAGMTTKVLSEDIHLLKQIRVTLDASKLSIVDARSLLNARANQVTGKGYEDVNDIGRDVCTLGFMGIENIHAVRDSLAAYCAASQAQGQEYFHAVGASGWLRHLAQIMKGAAFVVDELQRGVAVLVHCSDGWDRTAQLTALAQLYMDPYYRSLEGFEVLVEKEWCSFGHMFGLRAHSDSPTESSPVFLQWLDAVWQLVRQYPSSFEFTGHYLERLVEGVYSAGFLNFAGNCERERKEKLKELRETGSGALSLFTYLREHAMEGTMTAPLLNPLYRPPPYTLGGGGGGRVPTLRAVDVLRPCCELQGLEVWKTVYMRDNLLLHHREQQLSVEQGLRLQAYDYKRRIDLIEASMDRLPRGLRAKLRSSATGMNSPEWDRHDRLVAQLSADQDAAAAAAAAAQASSLPGMASRGRSQYRGSRSASANANDESSRSRSRSFNLPLRGWGKGGGGGGGGGGGVHGPDAHRIDRADTDTYRNNRVDTDIEEESIRAISEGSRNQSSGGTPSRGGAEEEEEQEEEVEERPGRSKSFFVGLGRWGPGRRRSESTPELSSPVAGGGVERRRRNSSSAAAAAATAANTRRNSLFSSFTGERPSVAPSVDPSPDSNNQGAARRFGKRSPGAGKRKGLRKSQTMVDVPAGRRSPPAPEPLRSAIGSGGKKAWGRSSRATTAATVDVEDDLEPRQQRAKSTSGGRAARTTRDKRSSPDARSSSGRTRWGRGRQSSSVGAEYYEEDEDEDLVPRRRAQSTAGVYQASAPAAEGVGTAKKGSSRAKGVWGSFQRTLGAGLSSKSTPDPVVQGRTGRLPRQTVSPTPVERLGTSDSSKSSSRSEKAKKTTTGGEREHPAREDAASAERVAALLKAEEDAEARRQLEHRIITLEMKLLVKDLVDTACVRAAERTSERSSERSSTRSSQSSLKWTPLSVSSSVAPAPLPRLSATAVQAERQSFFGNFWNGGGGKDGGGGGKDGGGGGKDGGDSSNGDGGLGGGQGIGGGQTGGGVAGHWGGFDRDGARQRRNRSAAAAVSTNGVDSKAVWKPDGTRYLASAQDQGRRGNEEENEDEGEKKKKANGEAEEEEEGFFQTLRKKLFEGDKTSSDHKSASAAATASEVKNEPPSLRLPTPVKQTAAPVAAVGAGATSGGSGSGSRPARRNSTPTGTSDSRPSRSKSMAAAAAAGPGKQRSSPAIMILPPPKPAERIPPANHPDAGAGGSRPVERSRAVTSAAPVPPPMAPELAEEAAAKFGLVRMEVASG